ncbi:MAG: hypothetical protein HXY47_05850 [Nitrospirae bacterium]|nr:hypothetical protein [Nitrospirota bacterium]
MDLIFYRCPHLSKIILHALRKTGMRTDFRSKITGNLGETGVEAEVPAKDY